VARVYAYSAPPSNILPRSCLVSLFAKRGDEDLPGSPLTQYHYAPQFILRDRVQDTANFKLPATWDEGDVEFAAVVRSLGSSAILPQHSDPIDLTFTPKEIPTYWIVSLNTGTEDIPELLDDSEIAIEVSYLKAVFPLADVTIVKKPWETVGVTTGSIYNPRGIEDLNDYLTGVSIAWMFGALSGESPFDFPDQIYGAMTPGGGISDPVWSSTIALGVVAKGGRGSSDDGIMAHEINHNLDKTPYEPDPNDTTIPIRSVSGTWGRHVGNPDNYDQDWGCGASGPDPDWPSANDEIQEVGFDTRQPWVQNDAHTSVVPADFPDIMSYCHDNLRPGKWISPYRWQNMFDYFPTVTASSRRAAAAAFDLSQISDMYYISGRLNVDGTGSLKPVITAPGEPFFPQVADGRYAVEFLDAQGGVLQSSTFHVSFIDVDDNQVDSMTFSFRMPVIEDPAVTSIVLLRDEQILDTIPVSANPPQITVSSPNGGELWSGLESISWQASDDDNDPLTFSVFYSPDNGHVWMPVAQSLEAQEYEVDTTVLPGGDSALIRVIASDGFHTVMDDSDETFTVQQNPPVAVIQEPNDGERFRSDQQITFSGNATDNEDEILSEESFTWVLNDQGIGTGRKVHATLPAGLHEITLRATDSMGEIGESTITIEVLLFDPFDLDEDGDGYTEKQGDCDDNDPEVHPGVIEVCDDDIDNDCDEEIDESDCNYFPDCTDAAPSISKIWPPNHKMVTIEIVEVTDFNDDPVTITIDAITQDEPVNDAGDGDTSPDGGGSNTDTAQVRAERSGDGNGRVYKISFTAADNQGGECEGSVQLCVPHDRQKGDECIDDGQIYDSTIP
jgi:hypothetical protein